MSDKTSQPSKIVHILKFVGGKTTILVLIVLAFALGYVIRGGSPQPPPSSSGSAHQHEEAAPAKSEVWTCSMHPQIQQPKPGKCPICGMDLIPVKKEAGDSGGGSRRFTTSDSAKAMMQIQTSAVERRFVTAEVRMVGKVDYDETKLGYITSWVPGRIDQLYVDYTGVEVKKGDHMVYLYSPELLTAQDELLRAAEALKQIRPEAPAVLKQTAEATLEAARSKLRRWGLTNGQISEAEKKGIVSDHITIYAPMGGTVIHREGQEGMYVDTGTRIYTIADLTSVWVKLDAYESDLQWLHYGQKVTFTTEAYPGQPFEGTIAFISPTLDNTTRTVKVRVNVPNHDGRLKPEMFVRAVVRSNIATGGRVMDPGLAGKWICPMHPDVVKDGPGKCDICGMAVVKAEDLGYVSAKVTDDDMPLVIPASAPLRTGKRAVVYVEVPDAKKPTYDGREIELGPRAGGYYIVRSGLSEGELVVTNGNFKIDSALQIMAKPSMMSAEDSGSGTEMESEDAALEMNMPDMKAGRNMPVAMERYDAPTEFKDQLAAFYKHYIDLHAALASDNFENAKKTIESLQKALGAVDMALLKGEAHMAWMKHQGIMKKALDTMAKATGLDGVRPALAPLSDELTRAIETFGITGGLPAYKAFCPMALDGKGAHWLQPNEDLLNPYYGEMMLKCGEIQGRADTGHEAAQAPAGQEGNGHE